MAENESLKTRVMTQYHSTTQMSTDLVEEILDPVSLDWDSLTPPPSRVVSFMSDFENELLSMEAPHLDECALQSDEVVLHGAVTPKTPIPHHSPPWNEPQDVARPAAQSSLTLAADSKGSENQGIENASFSTIDSIVPWTFPNASSAINYSSCDGTVFPPAWPAFGVGPTDSFAGAIPRVDLVQALMQVACTQERIALIDLERAKLHMCAC